MEQRPLRLGDVVDDYCPRERRVTNHAIVAIVEDVIRQTRCTACDAEHPYKGAREPRLRRKEPAARLYEQVLADVTGAPASPAQPLAAASPEPPAQAEQPAPAAAAAAPQEPEPEVRDDDRAVDGWLAHRQLIRATLPRTETEPTPRPIPEFTMYQRQTRGSRAFRQFANGNGNGNGEVNGNVAGRGHGGGRHGKHGRRHRNKRPR